MATVTLRLDEGVKDQLEAVARGRGQTLSDLIRSTLDQLLSPTARAGQLPTAPAPASLTMVERQQLALLHRILARVVGDDGDTDGDREYQLERAKVLESGFVQQYATEFSGIEPELSARDCEFVMDILDMFRRITFSIDKLEADGVELPEGISDQLAFSGFDLNDPREGKLLDYARHLVDEDHWTELLPTFSPDNDRGNSHSRRADVYARMLDELRTMPVDDLSLRGARDSFFLGVEELQRLADARVHPSQRTDA